MASLSLLGGALLSCSTASDEPTAFGALGDDAITVGSFDFAESELLAEVYSQTLEAGGYRVRRAFSLGPREFVDPALSQGLVELVPEYAGTALQFLGLGSEAPTADVDGTHAALVDVLDGSRLRALDPAPAQDTNAFVVTRATAEREDLRRLSDLDGLASDLTFGGPPECPTRALCLVGLEDVYGLTFANVLRLDAGGPVTRKALADGVVDVALLFSTDPVFAGSELVELADDRGLQPAENVTPVVHVELIERWGDDLVARVNDVSGRLTTDDLRRLNADVAAGRSITAVVAAWLATEGVA